MASQAQNYGLGGMTSGRANSVLAEIENPFAALYNPAILAAQPQSLFAFNTGVQQFRIQSSENFKVKDQSLTTWSLGFSLPFKLSKAPERTAGFGMTLSGPYQKLRTFSAYRPEDAFVMRYGGSDSQFKATLGLGLELWQKSLFLGGGLSLYLSTAGTAEQNIVGENPTGRISLDVGLNSAAILGIFSRGEKTQGAFTFHQALDPKFIQSIDGRISIAGADILHQPMLLKSTLYYEPQTLELEAQHQLGKIKISLGMAYEFWSQYQPPILVTEIKDNLGETRMTKVADVPLKNTLNPRASLEMPLFQTLTLSSGYQFRPTPVVDLSGPGNYLDSSAHILGVHFSHRMRPNDLIPWELKLGVYGQYHWLNSRTIGKVIETESTPKDYTFKGNAAVYGISLQSAL